ncbi:MerR family transcriptional regulator [Lacticaseibacillus kribbianus]|uniref:MerR family transcriptional regulator n=1 Tax=Lacticaseibacillus kribbianus TaxID=2926292 RepID=UPI001CD3EACA|nr:MerR family transcriptional regulator [Lacticaseibacillus kribbianus]
MADSINQTVAKLRQLDLTIGAGETKRVCGVTDAQLRYWEQKGLIHPVQAQGRNKHYTYHDVLVMSAIKANLDTGFTLRVAAERAAQEMAQSARLSKLLTTVAAVEADDDRLLVELGPLTDQPGRTVFATIAADGTVTYQSRLTKEA